MYKFRLIAASLSILALGSGLAQAQPRVDDGHPPGGGQMQHHEGPPGPQHGPDQHGNDHHGNDHHDWHRGDRVDHDDWNRGGRIDYRRNHLRQPPHGYEWREVNGTYILGAIATGVIADIILNGR